MEIENLQKLGLSKYESKCYLALIKYENLLGKDVGEKSGVPTTSVYRNLDSLKQKGFIQIIQNEPLAFQAVDPEIAVSSYIKNKKDELSNLENYTVKELKLIKKTGLIKKYEEVLELYTGRQQSYKLGNILMKEAKTSFFLIGSGATQSILDIIHSLRSAIKRNVVCKFIVTNPDFDRELIKELKKSDIKVKYYPLLGFSLLIKDDEESQVVIKDNKIKNGRIVLRIRNKDLSNAYVNYFNSIWEKSSII